MKSTTKKKNNINVSKNKTVTKKNKKLNKKKYNVLNNKNKNKYTKTKKNIKNKKNVSKLKLSTKTLRNKKKKKENKNKRFTKKKKMYGGGLVSELIGKFGQQQKITSIPQTLSRPKNPKTLRRAGNTSKMQISLNSDNITSIFEKIPLNLQIQIETKLVKIDTREKKEVTIENVTCTFKGAGSYGKVWKVRYKENNNVVEFAVKVPINWNIELDEIKILENIENKNIYDCDHIIPITYFGKKSIMMIYADGNLQEINQKFPNYFADNYKNLTAIAYIYDALMCLAKKDLYYYDIKPQNILYKHNTRENTIEIFLGDLGSLTESQYLDTFKSSLQTPYMRKKTNKGNTNFNNSVNTTNNLYKKYPELYYPWALSLLGLNLSSYFGEYSKFCSYEITEDSYKNLFDLFKSKETTNNLLIIYKIFIEALIEAEYKNIVDNEWVQNYRDYFETIIRNSMLDKETFTKKFKTGNQNSSSASSSISSSSSSDSNTASVPSAYEFWVNR